MLGFLNLLLKYDIFRYIFLIKMVIKTSDYREMAHLVRGNTLLVRRITLLVWGKVLLVLGMALLVWRTLLVRNIVLLVWGKTLLDRGKALLVRDVAITE